MLIRKQHRRPAALLAWFLTGASMAATAWSQTPSPAKVAGEHQVGDLAGTLDQALRFRFLGPYRGGRSSAVTGVPDDPFTFLIGSAGGVFRTSNAGESWENLSDADFEVSSIGAVAVAPSEPNVLYVGTGQATVRSNVSIGKGVYRSTDGGDTWQHIGLRDAGQIARIRVDPGNADRLWVGVVGNPFAPSPTRGVFRSEDGGDSWQHVLAFDEDTGVADLALDPANPRVLYAAAWTVERKPWTIRSGGDDDGLYKTIDGGDNWTRLSGGLPEGGAENPIGKIGIAVAPDGERLYALVEAEPEQAGLYRSDDAGTSWSHIATNVGRALHTRSWYYTHIHADPVDRDRVYVLAVNSYVSDDGGQTFERLRPPHGDGHDLWINPENPRIVAIANDGGVQISVDGATTWSSYHTQPTAEMYHVYVDEQFPYRVYGSQQDNTTISLPSRFLGALSPEAYWQRVGGCESAHIAFDPHNPVEVYAGCYAGEITRVDTRTGDWQQILLYPQMEFSRPPRQLRHRFNWNAPIRMSPHDSKVVYHASQAVHRTSDGGRNWTTISPDLTTNDPETQDFSGGPITRENTGAEVYNTIFALEESPLQPGLLWAGSDDGRVHLSRDGGETWADITPAEMPARGTVSMIELSGRVPGSALIAVRRYMLDDWSPYIFRTEDYGRSWRRLNDGSNGIPADTPVRVVREDPDHDGLLYAGTEFGLYLSFDAGASWQRQQLGLPPVPITDLRVHRGDLVVATQGRGFYILDDLTPLHHLAAARETVERQGIFLFPPRPAIRIVQSGSSGPIARRGENPPSGVTFVYALATAHDKDSDDEVTLEIFDQAGTRLRLFSNRNDPVPNPDNIYFADRGQIRLPSAAGANRFLWNFRYPPVDVPDDVYVYGLTHGPRARPGSYRARLSSGDAVSEESFEIVGDPRLEVSPEDFRLQLETSLSLYQDLARVYDAVRTLRAVREQVSERVQWNPLLPELGELAGRLFQKLDALELELIQPLNEVADDVENFEQGIDADLAYLYEMIDAADRGPTTGQVVLAGELHLEVERLLAQLRRWLDEDLAQIERLLRDSAVPTIQIVPPA